MKTKAGNEFVCPFCDGVEFDDNLWCMDEGEIDALECRDCLAGAPKHVWEAYADHGHFITKSETDLQLVG